MNFWSTVALCHVMERKALQTDNPQFIQQRSFRFRSIWQIEWRVLLGFPSCKTRTHYILTTIVLERRRRSAGTWHLHAISRRAVFGLYGKWTLPRTSSSSVYTERSTLVRMGLFGDMPDKRRKRSLAARDRSLCWSETPGNAIPEQVSSLY